MTMDSAKNGAGELMPDPKTGEIYKPPVKGRTFNGG